MPLANKRFSEVGAILRSMLAETKANWEREPDLPGMREGRRTGLTRRSNVALADVSLLQPDAPSLIHLLRIETDLAEPITFA